MIMTNFIIEERKIAVIGLGYVGLPLAVEFGKMRPIMGFDINVERIDALKRGYDSTLGLSKAELETARLITYTNTLSDIKDCDTLVMEAKRVLKGADIVTISGWNRCKGDKESVLENALLKKFNGEIYEMALFSQISNGKTCKCWFEECRCLPVTRSR